MVKNSVRADSNDVLELVGHIVCISYEHRYRNVLVADVRVTKDGNTLLVGLDEDSNDWRSFRADRIPRRHTIKVVR